MDACMEDDAIFVVNFWAPETVVVMGALIGFLMAFRVAMILIHSCLFPAVTPNGFWNLTFV